MKINSMKHSEKKIEKFIDEIKYEDVTLKCYSICRSDTLSLYAEAYSDNKLLFDAELDDFEMKFYDILIEKVIDNEVVDNVELMTGVSYYSSVAAFNAIKSEKLIDFDDIESRLEHKGIPYLKGFNDTTKTYIRKKIRKITPEYEMEIRKKSFSVKFITDNRVLKAALEIAADQSK